jgi:protein pelota
LSSDHESGTRLEGLGGIAAILTFPLEDLDEDEDEEQDEEKEVFPNGTKQESII